MKFLNYISILIQKFKSSLFFQNIAVVASGNIAAKLVAIISAPIITRLYTPEHYGVFSVFASVVAIGGSIATLRYAVTIPIAKEESLADNLLKLSFTITLILSLFFGILILFFGNELTKLFSIDQITPYLWILPLAFLGKGIYDALTNWNVRHKYFRVITRTKISQGFSASVLKIGLGFIGIKPLGLLIGILAQETAGIISLSHKMLKEKPGFLKKIEWKKIRYAAIRYKRFPIIQSWSQLLLGLGAQLPVLFIAGFYGAKEAGLFGLAHNLISMPMDLLGASVSNVYFGEIAKYGKSNPEKIYRLSVSVMKKMFLFALAPILAIIIGGPKLFSLALGHDWFDAGVFAQIMAVFILFRFVGSPIASCLNVFEKQGIQLMLNVLRVILIAGVFSASKFLNLTAEYAIAAYSAVFSAYALVGIYIIFHILKKQKSKATANK